MNKKIYFLVITNLLFTLLATAQVIKGQAPVRIEAPVPPHPAYDSSTNDVTYINCRQFIGQKILMRPISSLLQAQGRSKEAWGFYLYPRRDIMDVNNVYKPIKSNEPQYSSYNVYATDYTYLNGKNFEIIDLIDHTTNLKYSGTNENGVFFKLKNIENNDIIYYELFKDGKDYVSTGPWVCMGYYEKVKQIFLNITLIAQRDLTDLYDINTGKLTSCNIGEAVTCSDVTFIDTKANSLSELCVIFKKSTSEEIAVSLKWGPLKANQLFNLAEKGSFKKLDAVIKDEKKAQQEQLQQIKQEIAIEQAQQDEINALIKKYGKNFGTKIARGEVEIGMTKNMCREAWGEPEMKRETKDANGMTEKWFYPQARFLYFIGDKLNSLQY